MLSTYREARLRGRIYNFEGDRGRHSLLPLRRHRAFIQPQSHLTRPFMNLPPIAILVGFVLLAACATPAPGPQGDAPPEPVPAGITPLTQEQDELLAQ
jgi:hypothetical protein